MHAMQGRSKAKFDNGNKFNAGGIL